MFVKFEDKSNLNRKLRNKYHTSLFIPYNIYKGEYLCVMYNTLIDFRINEELHPSVSLFNKKCMGFGGFYTNMYTGNYYVVNVFFSISFKTYWGRGNSTVVRVSVYEAGGPGSLPVRSVVIER